MSPLVRAVAALELLTAGVLAVVAVSCTPAQIQTAETNIVATVNAACADYAPLSGLLHAVPNPAVQGVLLFGDAMCAADGTVQTTAIAKLDPSSAAWVGGLTQSLKQMAAAPHTVN